MGIVFRQSIKSTIVIFTGALLGAVATYVCTLAFSKAELGFFTNIIYLGATIQLFVMFGMGSVLATYIPKYEPGNEKRKVLITLGTVITFAAIVIFSAAFFILKPYFIGLYKPEDQIFWERFYNWLPVLTFFWAFLTLYESYLLSQTKIAISAFVKEIVIRALSLLLVGFYALGYIDFTLFIISNIFIYLLAAVVLFRVSAKTPGFGFSFNWMLFNKREYKQLIHFAWYHLLFVVSINLMNYIDTLMLAPLDKNGLESAASYRVAVFIATVMAMPFRAMQSSSFATLNNAFIENDQAKVQDLFTRSGINILLASLGMFIVIAVNLDNVIAILPKGYEAVKPVVLILMLGKLIDAATGLNNELISISKYYKFNFRVSALLLVLVITFDRILIPQYSVYGAAWGATAALIVFNVIKLTYLWKKLNLHPFTKGSLYVLLAGGIASITGISLPGIQIQAFEFNKYINPLVDGSIRTVIVIVAYVALLIWLKPSEDIKTFLHTIRSKKRLY
jgi:O-antigen/teichoic acid export membrane protein